MGTNEDASDRLGHAGRDGSSPLPSPKTGAPPRVDGADKTPRILIVRRSSLGDVVVSLPALVAIRRAFPHAHIAWLVEDSFADLVRGHECLDEVITIRRFSARAPRQWWRETRRVGRGLRERRFDLAIDLQGLGKSALMCYLSGAPRRLGFAGETRGMLGMRWVNELVPVPREIMAVPRALQMAHYLGAPIYPVEFRYPISAEAREWAEEVLGTPPADLGTDPFTCVLKGGEAEAPAPLVGLVLGASTEVKAWPVGHFVRLAEDLRGKGLQVVLIGGRAEAEREAAVQQRLSQPVRSVVGRTDLPRLAAVLARTDAVVSGDTGALHIAAAVGTPVVGLYGPTSPEATGPYGEQHRILWDRPPCGPCNRRPRCKDYRCMRDLTPERVSAALHEVLAADPRRKTRDAQGQERGASSGQQR